MTTAERMKILGKKNDSRLDIKVPSELKNLVCNCAVRDEMPLSYWIKMALIEKVDRDKPE